MIRSFLTKHWQWYYNQNFIYIFVNTSLIKSIVNINKKRKKLPSKKSCKKNAGNKPTSQKGYKDKLTKVRLLTINYFY